MPTLQMEEEFASENVMTDEEALQLFYEMCDTIHTKMEKWRDQIASDIVKVDPATGKRDWKINCRIEMI